MMVLMGREIWLQLHSPTQKILWVISSLAMVDKSLALDSSKAPKTPLRAVYSRTSTTVAVEVVDWVVVVTEVKIRPL